MGFRIQKRIRILKGLTLNLSKSDSSWTFGRPGASVNFRGNKVTGNVGIPGTGLSYRQSLDNPEAQQEPGTRRGGTMTLLNGAAREGWARKALVRQAALASPRVLQETA